jgi:hypothetical protein
MSEVKVTTRVGTDRPDAPRRLEDATVGWFNRALGSVYAGVEIADVRVDGCMGHKQNKARVHLRYGSQSPGHQLPATMVIKGNFPGAASEGTGAEFAMTAEAISYRDIVPLLGSPNTPHCHYIDVGGDAVVILMDDLSPRGVKFLDAFSPLSYGQAAAFIEAQAKIHASCWNSDLFKPGAQLGPSTAAGQNASRVFEGYYPSLMNAASWGTYAALPRGRATSHIFHDVERVSRGWQGMRDVMRSCAQVIIHGDEHLGNLYLEKNGTPGFIDWFARPDRWVTGIAYFLVTTLDIADRKNWERPLLAHYISCLNRFGSDAPAFDHAWFAYRCANLYPLVVWLNNNAAWQPEAVNTVCAARAGAACLDHDVFALLGC